MWKRKRKPAPQPGTPEPRPSEDVEPPPAAPPAAAKEQPGSRVEPTHVAGGHSQTKPRRRLVTATRLRVVVLLVALAALIGVIATFAFRNTGESDEAAAPIYTTIPAPTTGAVAGEAFGTAAPGDCLTWSEADARDLSKVDCAEEHLFEVASQIDLSEYPGSEFGPDAPFPGELRFGELRTELCVPAVQQYLGARYDPYGKYSVNLINPGETGWKEGERTIRCGLQHVGTAGQVFPITGRIAEIDQARVFEPGTCIGINQDIPADPVPCDQPHAYEVVAIIDLGAEFTGGWPRLEDQDRFLDQQCTARTNEYLGSPERLGQLTLTAFWENVRLASWAAGTKRVNCAIGAQVETGGFATITGSAKGDILINGQPPSPPPPPG
jgi:hypothetical protein